MTVSYRDKFNAYKQEHENNYANIGSVFPVPVDSYSGNASVGPTGMPNGGSGGGGEIEEYSYKGYLYCDGRSLKIREYPQLYQVIRNSYGGNTAKTITTYTEVGGLRRLYWVNNKLFMNFLEDPSVNSTSKLPYPYGVNFLIKDDTGASPAGPGLGSLPSNVFDYTTVFLTKAPTETSSDNAADKAWRGGGWAQSLNHSAAEAKNSESLDLLASSQVAFVDSINSSRGTLCNSGSWWSGSRCSKWSCVYNRTQTPGRTRPARPARCRADAREHQAVSRVGQAENNFSDPCRWCLTSFTRPQSTTQVTSGIVTLLSATLVASTILRAYP